jgi:DNA-directed RNA polymerase omega subunit
MDIISLPIEIDREKIDSRFRLVNMAAQRAKELSLGAKKKIQTKSKKVTTIAIEEALEGKLEYIVGEEAAKAREEERKFDYRKLLEERRRVPADIRELEKDLKVYLHSKEEEGRELSELFSNEGQRDIEE